MQKGMNSSIRWKRLAGETMGVKKNRERFSIKFNENDPAHDEVIRLLEKQGAHGKAQFIANAVLHYVHCTQNYDAALSHVVERETVEKIIRELLSGQSICRQENERTQTDVATVQKQTEIYNRSVVDAGNIHLQDKMNKEAMVLSQIPCQHSGAAE